MSGYNERFNVVLQRLDTLHAADPRVERVDGKDIPHELLYAQRMSAWLERVAPEAPETLRLAVRAQHLQRWTLPRDDYPRDRPGYLAWRRDLGRRQAEQAADILRDAGYDEQECDQVARWIRKEGLRRDPHTQALEDTACLVFLEYYLSDFAKEHDEDKLIRIVQKTWKKMSPRGHELAMTIALPEAEKRLIEKALA
ncbi:DUF4202 domain-containing protein [Halomonas sp. McH1-25]|uniref:DUF4202 domain-containing protein n=1 Tax=unclassified Halomonas TaxID=2609666 RepID=UPI001EF519E3|nr:DUF4202 domain-containing protein [Halomonas sp. McH1-25]MCP1342366.1 DUF4202 domain-containing protein [Halomonas sp. FL8]MCP1360380.1 DUF4202 domain-containing protein [Halomonas sp. BBD45]MCP1364545.1 DUF4202 domain-containing protein [Halomonas sp. BBD48]